MEINKGPDLDAKDERDKQVKLTVVDDIIKILEDTDTVKISDVPHRFIRVY
jgi:hypothetical protein